MRMLTRVDFCTFTRTHIITDRLVEKMFTVLPEYQ